MLWSKAIGAGGVAGGGATIFDSPDANPTGGIVYSGDLISSDANGTVFFHDVVGPTVTSSITVSGSIGLLYDLATINDDLLTVKYYNFADGQFKGQVYWHVGFTSSLRRILSGPNGSFFEGVTFDGTDIVAVSAGRVYRFSSTAYNLISDTAIPYLTGDNLKSVCMFNGDLIFGGSDGVIYVNEGSTLTLKNTIETGLAISALFVTDAGDAIIGEILTETPSRFGVYPGLLL